MSSIASLRVVKLADLRTIVDDAASAGGGGVIGDLGVEVGRQYDWSGYVMMNVLDSLEERGVELGSPALHEASEAIDATHGYTTLLASDAKAALDRLDPAAFAPSDLLDGPIELELDDQEAREALTDTLSLLRQTIEDLSDDEVLLLHIG